MTRKHFKELAVIVRWMHDEHGYPDPLTRSQAGRLASYLANLCQEENPRFDRARFLQACGLDAEQAGCAVKCPMCAHRVTRADADSRT